MYTPPLFLLEGYDIGLFFTAEELCSYTEPIDVENNEYKVFDADGRRLKLGVINGHVVISPAGQHAADAHVLENTLRTYFIDYQKVGSDVIGNDLKSFVAYFVKHRPDLKNKMTARGFVFIAVLAVVFLAVVGYVVFKTV